MSEHMRASFTKMLRQATVLTVLTVVLLLGSKAYSDLDNLSDRELPILGDEASSILSPAEEDKIGKLLLFQLRTNLPLVEEPLVKYYVQKHALHIAQHSDLPSATLHPIVIDSKDFNAFAVPGGVVGVNLGLFLFAQDVHEYSSVIAHELAHLSQRHYARRLEQEKSMTIKNIVGFLTSAAMIASGATQPGFATLVGTQSLLQNQALAYSRSQEREADRIGLNTLESANYDPHGAPRMFERMQIAFRYHEAPAEYLSTHPITQNRIADLRGQVAEFGFEEYEDSRDYQYIQVWASHHFQEDQNRVMESTRNEDDPFAMALSLSATNQHDDAMVVMKRLNDENPDSIIVSSAYANILLKANRTKQAIAFLEIKLDDYPDNKPLSMYLARALINDRSFEDATGVLWRQARLNPNDRDVWLLLAESSGLAKKIIDVHRARAEALVLNGRYPDAIKQLQLAKALAEENYRLNVSLDQRILDLRLEFEELEG